MALLCGRAGRVTTKNGGFRPGQSRQASRLLLSFTAHWTAVGGLGLLALLHPDGPLRNWLWFGFCLLLAGREHCLLPEMRLDAA